MGISLTIMQNQPISLLQLVKKSYFEKFLGIDVGIDFLHLVCDETNKYAQQNGRQNWGDITKQISSFVLCYHGYLICNTQCCIIIIRNVLYFKCFTNKTLFHIFERKFYFVIFTCKFFYLFLDVCWLQINVVLKLSLGT